MPAPHPSPLAAPQERRPHRLSLRRMQLRLPPLAPPAMCLRSLRRAEHSAAPAAADPSCGCSATVRAAHTIARRGDA